VKTEIYRMLTALIICFTAHVTAGAQDVFYKANDINTPSFGNMDMPDNEIRSKHLVEVSHGQAFIEWTDAWMWMFSCNYLYRFYNSIAAGGGIGLQFDWTGLYPALSANLIFGNKSENFAAGLDLKYMFTELIEDSRLWFTIGGYYKNFFIKAMPTFLFGYPQEWYFETGYSFDIHW